jgi:hypothetical protein
MRTWFRAVAAVTLSLVLATGSVLLGSPGAAAAAQGDKKPNLQMLSLRDWQIQVVNGRRLLRFTTIFVNAGRGHFELHASRASTAAKAMKVRQRMFRWDGTSRMIDTPALARYSGDGHDHWHVQEVVTYEAWNEADPLLMRRGAKTGFCFFDTTPWNLSLPGARQSSYYPESWCGTRASLSIRSGVSVGWGDRYPWNFAYQWIDITDLPGGTYRVRATVDIQDHYDESVETDNCVWTRIRIPQPGSTRAPTVLANGADCGLDAITPVTSFAHGVTWDPPKEVRMRQGSHVGYRFNSQGTALGTKKVSLKADRIALASARAVPPGLTSRYVYMTTGRLAGYWLKVSSAARVLP